MPCATNDICIAVKKKSMLVQSVRKWGFESDANMGRLTALASGPDEGADPAAAGSDD
jgi:hypothetical protein